MAYPIERNKLLESDMARPLHPAQVEITFKQKNTNIKDDERAKNRNQKSRGNDRLSIPDVSIRPRARGVNIILPSFVCPCTVYECTYGQVKLGADWFLDSS